LINIRNIKLLKLSVVLVLLTTLICSSFGVVLATNTTIPDGAGSGVTFEEFVHMYAQYYSFGDKAEYERIYNTLISAGLTTGVPVSESLAPAPHAIVPTADGGWALQSAASSERASTGAQTTRANYWATSLVSSPPTSYGWVNNPGYSIGSPDSYCAELVTTGYSGTFAGEAILNLHFGSGARTGQIEVYARTPNATANNYFVVQYYYSGAWNYLGTGQVTSSSITMFPFPTGALERVSVTCTTMPPYGAGTPVLQNYVNVDAVGVY